MIFSIFMLCQQKYPFTFSKINYIVYCLNIFSRLAKKPYINLFRSILSKLILNLTLTVTRWVQPITITIDPMSIINPKKKQLCKIKCEFHFHLFDQLWPLRPCVMRVRSSPTHCTTLVLHQNHIQLICTTFYTTKKYFFIISY